VFFCTRAEVAARPAGHAAWVHQVNGGSDLVGDHLVGMRPGNVMAKAFRAGFVRREALLFEWR